MAVSAILVLLNGVFVGYEFAILRVHHLRIGQMVAAGNRGARFALRHKEHVNEYLAVCQLGITVVTLALTVAFEPTVQTLLGPILTTFMSPATARGVSLGLAVFIATSIHVTFGELVPKSLALISPTQLVVRTARSIEILYRLARPSSGSLTASRPTSPASSRESRCSSNRRSSTCTRRSGTRTGRARSTTLNWSSSTPSSATPTAWSAR